MNRQEELLIGWGGGRWYSSRIINKGRWMTSCNFTHALCWWHRFWFLPGFTSIYPLASGHPGVEIKILYCRSLEHCTVKYTKAQPPVEDSHMWQCMPDTSTNVTWDMSRGTCNLWDMQIHICIFESSQFEGSYLEDLLYSKAISSWDWRLISSQKQEEERIKFPPEHSLY